MFIIAAGAGTVGYHLLRALVAYHEVRVIELDPARVDFIAEELGSEVIMQGDACDAATMVRAGMERADLVVAVTGDDQDNLTFCQIAKAKFDVKRAVARISNPANEELFRQLGIDATVSATNLILAHIEQELPWTGLIPLATLHSHGLELVEVRIPTGASVVGRQVRQILLPVGSMLVLIMEDDGTPRMPTPDATLRAEDVVVAVTNVDSGTMLREAITSRVG
jgi:trk system potassium uptake protein TrkA